MTQSVEKQINSYVNKAITAKQNYREYIQTAYEIFVANYNGALNHNSQPLLNILKATGKDIEYLKKYIYNSTNIVKLRLSDKGGLLLEFEGEFAYNDDYIDNNKWYDDAIKDDKKAVVDIDDKALLKILNGLLKKVNDSTKLTINKDNLLKSVNTMLTMTKQAVDVAK